MRHIPIIETEPITNPPSTEYERGKWYKRRGYLEKALRSFKEAAQSAPTDKTSSGWKEVDLSWLEYGLLSMRMRSFGKSEEAFRTVVQHSGTYVQEALNQWAALLHMQGISDQTIGERLLDETRNFPSSNIMVGRSLFYIGAYTYAAHCFAKQGSLYPDTCIQYVTCLIMTGQVLEALPFIDSYLRDLTHHLRELPRPRTFEGAQLARIRQLCEWNIKNSIPDRFIVMSETLELARAAVSLNMISIAEHLLTNSGDHAYYALICFLYDEGHRGLAISKLNQLEALPLQEQDSHSLKVCFIAAENLYDQGRYDEAASLLEQLRLAYPGRTEIRFGEAACYLQSALISLSARLEEQYASATARKEIEQYLDNINAALHVVENTNWHTSWSPAQKRRENHSPLSSLN
ncbi:tetratricopeptide repeat protein [Paenibacillus sp. ISL-20]|uniref:tetratricopeptide repeat protein n=1 Tax=Paenibacillus sp. ISL-20 TaxID=2819163 RepID=UPI001BEBAEC8|nr:tetratricopeptide repeat protein [Paenibacillus sp. ISL-20]MBT2760799.1 tetratricopeptide repeat protein [Paenibacillus sp. ISL-20]